MIKQDSRTYRSILYIYIPLMYVAIGTMISVYAERVPYKDWVRFIMAVTGICLMYRQWTKSFDSKGVFRVLAPFSLLILAVSFIYYFVRSGIGGAHSIRDLGDSVLWISVLFLSYKAALNGECALLKSRYIALTIPLYFVIFSNVRLYFIMNTDDTAMISTAYYALFLLPFALLIKRKWIMWMLILFVFLTVVLSAKRTGFIAFLGALLIYFLNALGGKNTTASKRVGYLITFSIVLLSGYFAFARFIEINNISILDRLSRLSEDGGSGRDVIWEYSWDLVKKSDLWSLILGHGFNTVYHTSILEVSAHTDFIEVVYDYGIIGSLLYVFFYWKLYRYFLYVKENFPEYAAPFAVSLFLTLVLSAFAHLIIYPTHFLFACLFWGLIIGECDKKIRNNG